MFTSLILGSIAYLVKTYRRRRKPDHAVVPAADVTDHAPLV
jgi:hypothetical protein